MAINLQRQKILTQLITKFKYIAINQKTSPLLFRAYNNSNTTLVSINLYYFLLSRSNLRNSNTTLVSINLV